MQIQSVFILNNTFIENENRSTYGYPLPSSLRTLVRHLTRWMRGNRPCFRNLPEIKNETHIFIST